MIKFNYSVILFSLLAVTSCSNEPTEEDKFCDCLSATKQLNDFALTIEASSVSKSQEEKMTKLRATKHEKCDQFRMMSGPKMKELRESCTKN